MNYSNVEKVINQYMKTPFCYGQHDCCVFAARVIRAFHGIEITGLNIYENDHNIMSFFRNAQVRSFVEAVQYIAALNNWTETNPSLRQTGDLLLLRDNNRFIVGVQLPGTVVVTGKNGLMFLTGPKIIKCYRTNPGEL